MIGQSIGSFHMRPATPALGPDRYPVTKFMAGNSILTPLLPESTEGFEDFV